MGKILRFGGMTILLALFIFAAIFNIKIIVVINLLALLLWINFLDKSQVDSSILVDELLVLLKELVSILEIKNDFIILGKGKTLEEGKTMLEKRLKKGAKVYGLKILASNLREALFLAQEKKLIRFRGAEVEDEVIVGIQLVKEEE